MRILFLGDVVGISGCSKIMNNLKLANGMIINPGALSHYSYAIRDAISSTGIPTVEVHLSHIMDREDFRKISVIKDVCISQVYGLGKKSYLEGLKILNEIN